MPCISFYYYYCQYALYIIFTIITVNLTVMKFTIGTNLDYMFIQNRQKNTTHVTPLNLYRLAIIIVMFNLFIKT